MDIKSLNFIYICKKMIFFSIFVEKTNCVTFDRITEKTLRYKFVYLDFEKETSSNVFFYSGMFTNPLFNSCIIPLFNSCITYNN
jgi:hypothetical protein